MEGLVSSVLTPARAIIQACEELLQRTTAAEQGESFVEDLNRVHKDAQTLVGMVRQQSADRLKIVG